jgi:hypothetical protein
MVLEYTFSASDPAKSTFPTNYLTLLPNLDSDKRKIVAFILEKKPELMTAAVRLVREMPEAVIGRLLEKYFENPSGPAMESIIYEVATYFPDRVRSFEQRIKDETIREAMLPGAPDDWVDDLVRKYRTSADPVYLRKIGRIRTDHAVEAMLGLWPSATEKDRQQLYLCIESSGVFPDTRKASVYFKTYRGVVVGRGESPHLMGGQFAGGVPICAICKTPANRMLTLKASELEFEIDRTFDPSFFWINCQHPQDYVVVRFTKQGIEGILTPTSPGPAGVDLVPGELALQLEIHPNQLGYGIDVVPGYGLHQVGGYPPWLNVDRFPRCPICQKGMRYLASVDCGMTLFGELPLGGMLYGFWCERCAVSATLRQGT